MILFFSATGNSGYVAKRIADGLSDERLDLFERIREENFSPIASQAPLVVVTPTYAWRIPRIVALWMERTPITAPAGVYFVMTCGGSNGNAGAYLKRLCAKKGLAYRGCAGIVMPENYIALFTTPAPAEAKRIIDAAEPVIDRVIEHIKAGSALPEKAPSLMDRLNSGIVNDLFYPAFVHAKKFRVTDACISCGMCVRACPLSNIHLESGKPVWGSDCTHCMACISCCPKEAIEYGRHSMGLPRYTFKRAVSAQGAKTSSSVQV